MPRVVGPILKTLIFTLVVPPSVAVVVPLWLLEFALPRPASGARGLLGALLIALGAAAYFWCAWDFAYYGLGTPAIVDPPKVLVARGLHRFVRNPMYLGVLAVVAGESAWFHSTRLLTYALCLALIFHFFVVLYEEPTLRKKFGEAYEDYRRTVPRWIPTL